MFLAFLCSFTFEYVLGFKIVGPTTTSFDYIKPDGTRKTVEALSSLSNDMVNYNNNNPFTFTFEFPGCTFTQAGYIPSYSIVPEVGEDYLSNICQVKKFPQYFEKTYLKVENGIENEDVKLYYENDNEKTEIAKGDHTDLLSISSYFKINFYVTSSKCTSYEKIGNLKSTGDKDTIFVLKDKNVPSKCIQQTPSQTYYLKIKNSLSENYKLFALRSGSYEEIQRGTTKTYTDSSTFTMNLYITSSKCSSYTLACVLQASTSSSDVDVIDDSRVPAECVDNSPPSQTYYLNIKNSLSENYKLFALRSGSYEEIQRGTTKTFTDSSTFTMNLYITSSKCSDYTLACVLQASTSSSDVDVIDDSRVPLSCAVTDEDDSSEDESSKILKYTLSSTVNNIRRPIQIHIVKEAVDGCMPSKNSPLESLSSSKDNALEKSGTSNNVKNSKNSPNVMLIVGFIAVMAAIVAIVVMYKKNAGKSSQ